MALHVVLLTSAERTDTGAVDQLAACGGGVHIEVHLSGPHVLQYLQDEEHNGYLCYSIQAALQSCWLKEGLHCQASAETGPDILRS